MNIQTIDKILQETAYVRTSGTEEELRCARYIAERCAELGGEAYLEPFDVPMATMHKAALLADGREIPCKGFLCAGSWDVEAPLYYLPGDNALSLDGCRGKIVLSDTGMSYWRYHDILDHGAVGFITYDGNANYADCDIDQKELRSYVSQGRKLPGVNINAKDAIALVRDGVESVRIILEQDEYMGVSHNVILDLPGEIDETVILSAHYDTTSLSTGAYDNMSGCIGLLGIAEKFAKEPRRRGLRFIWCGSEERGLLGSKAYTAAHPEALEKAVLNVNLDMIGCIMGRLNARCTCEERMVHFISYLSDMVGYPVHPSQGVHSSDSTPFADKGVPAVSFARYAPQNTATIHNRYDTLQVMRASRLAEDIDFLNIFVNAMVNAVRCPVAREIPDNMREEIDIYLARKRGK